MERYVLCLREKNKEGKEEIYPIYEDTLKNIDMYTTYKLCFNSKGLFNCFPDKVKCFINNHLIKGNVFDKKYEFFIRKKCKDIRRGRTDLEVLYFSDSDIVYANEKDIYSALCEMKVNDKDYNNDDPITVLKKDFFSNIYKILFSKESKLSDRIDKNNENNFNNHSRIRSVATNPSNLKIIAEYVCYDYELKREFLILLKSYKKKMDDFFNKKTRLVNKDILEKRIGKRPFSIYNANEIINRMLNEEEEYYYSKYPDEHKIEVSNKLVKKENVKKKNPLEDNPDYLKYLAHLKEKENFEESSDTYEDDNYDDFLGPDKPNDPRYWSIN